MASGDTLYTITPESNQPPASAYATPDRRNGLLVLDFDADTDENAIFVGILPRHYAGGGITVYLHWMASSAISGTCRWAVAIERHLAGTDDSDSDSFATAQTAGGTASGTSGSETVTSITFTDGAQMDSLTVGERFRLKVTRDADGTSGTDSVTGDTELVAVEIKET